MYFEVKNNSIEKKIVQQNQLEYIDPKICYFKFTTKEWAHKEKYAIFWIEKDNTIIKNIGKKCETHIALPTDNKNFTIQIYVNDNLKTEKYVIGQTIEETKQKEIKPKTMGLIHRVFEQLNTKIDNVIYSDNTIKFYANDELVRSIDLQEIEIDVDSSLSNTSKNPVQNKVIKKELDKKQDSSSLSEIAITGEYDDLKNKPNEFHPSRHMHTKDDLINFDFNVDEDIEIILMKLTDDITEM